MSAPGVSDSTNSTERSELHRRRQIDLAAQAAYCIVTKENHFATPWGQLDAEERVRWRFAVDAAEKVINSKIDA